LASIRPSSASAEAVAMPPRWSWEDLLPLPHDLSAHALDFTTEDFGARAGCAWREADEAETDRETVLRDLLRIVAFNPVEAGRGTPLRRSLGNWRGELPSRRNDSNSPMAEGDPIRIIPHCAA
jgi:hypothetical protein